MRLLFRERRPAPGALCYWEAGGTYDVPEEHAQKLIDEGAAVRVDERVKTTTARRVKPEE